MSRTTLKTRGFQESDHLNSALALGWCFLVNPLENNKFAVLVDRLLRRRVPNGCLRDILNGREAEVRQQAFSLLFRQYLEGNQQLRSATEIGDLIEVLNQLQKSLNASLRIAKYAIRDSLLRDLKRFEGYDEDFKGMPKHRIHPACLTRVSELPVDVQRNLLFQLLDKGVREGSISVSSAEMTMKMVDHGIKQIEMAAELGITRQAINQRIYSLAEIVRKSLERTEWLHLLCSDQSGSCHSRSPSPRSHP